MQVKNKDSSIDKQSRANLVREYLQKQYPNPPIPLEHSDAFTLLVAVMLSAQCTDIRVNQITPKLFAIWDNPYSFSQAKPTEVEQIIKPCGLGRQKSTAIVKTSQILCEKYSGQVPKERKLLEQLPGVGGKTAGVVRCQAFREPEFPVDTHILRLSHRWGLTQSKMPSKVEEHLKQLFPREDWIDMHLQIIYWGREFCPARGCDNNPCQICQELIH